MYHAWFSLIKDAQDEFLALNLIFLPSEEAFFPACEMRPNGVLQRLTSAAAAAARRRQRPPRPRPKRLSGKQPWSQLASNLAVVATAPLAAFAYIAANSPNPTIALLTPDENEHGEFLVLENLGPGWLEVSNFAVTTDSDALAAAVAAAAAAAKEEAAAACWLMASGFTVTDDGSPLPAPTAPPPQGRAAFERVAKDLKEEAELVKRTLDKLLFDVPTSGTGVQPGGRFVVIKVKKGETLSPAEKLLLQMVHDRWTVSFGYRWGVFFWRTYCKRLDIDTGERSVLKRERAVAAKVVAGEVVTELDEAEVHLYRLKYKAQRVKNWKTTEENRRDQRRGDGAGGADAGGAGGAGCKAAVHQSKGKVADKWQSWFSSWLRFSSEQTRQTSAAQALHTSRAKAEALAELQELHIELSKAVPKAREERNRLRDERIRLQKSGSAV